MRIKKAWIDAAEEKYACWDALAWLRLQPRTLKQLVEEHPFWASWALASRCLPKEARLYVSKHVVACYGKNWRALFF